MLSLTDKTGLAFNASKSESASCGKSCLIRSVNAEGSEIDDILSGIRDSNPRPSVWETDALPTELIPLVGAVKLAFFIQQYAGETLLLIA